MHRLLAWIAKKPSSEAWLTENTNFQGNWFAPIVAVPHTILVGISSHPRRLITNNGEKYDSCSITDSLFKRFALSKDQKNLFRTQKHWKRQKFLSRNIKSIRGKRIEKEYLGEGEKGSVPFSINGVNMKYVTSLVLLVIGFPAIAAESLMGVSVELPDAVEWKQITNESDGNQYLKEWIPSDSDTESFDWIIVVQKLELPKKTSAKKYFKGIFSLAQQSCTHMKYNGPDKIVADGLDSLAGMFMCAQVKNTDYGTLTHQRVISQGKIVYVITSEHRTAPTKVAGVLRFNNSSAEDVTRFMERQGASSSFVRKSVQLCFDETGEC